MRGGFPGQRNLIPAAEMFTSKAPDPASPLRALEE